jgi:hypothetical protein
MDYYDDELSVYGLIRDLFCATAIGWFLVSLHRIARGVLLIGQVAAYDELSDAYAPEEREVLIHKIKTESLSR